MWRTPKVALFGFKERFNLPRCHIKSIILRRKLFLEHWADFEKLGFLWWTQGVSPLGKFLGTKYTQQPLFRQSPEQSPCLRLQAVWRQDQFCEKNNFVDDEETSILKERLRTSCTDFLLWSLTFGLRNRKRHLIWNKWRMHMHVHRLR